MKEPISLKNSIHFPTLSKGDLKEFLDDLELVKEEEQTEGKVITYMPYVNENGEKGSIEIAIKTNGLTAIVGFDAFLEILIETPDEYSEVMYKEISEYTGIDLREITNALDFYIKDYKNHNKKKK